MTNTARPSVDSLLAEMALYRKTLASIRAELITALKAPELSASTSYHIREALSSATAALEKRP